MLDDARESLVSLCGKFFFCVDYKFSEKSVPIYFPDNAQRLSAINFSLDVLKHFLRRHQIRPGLLLIQKPARVKFNVKVVTNFLNFAHKNSVFVDDKIEKGNCEGAFAIHFPRQMSVIFITQKPRPFLVTRFLYKKTGGEVEIRTLEGLAPLTVFKTAAFNHSATSPQ